MEKINTGSLIFFDLVSCHPTKFYRRLRSPTNKTSSGMITKRSMQVVLFLCSHFLSSSKTFTDT
uniref:Uncharacterized protein n=1 Tax=Arundo donax TaxID=35708 RepID=A0A0A9H7I1_ARUDO